MAPLECADGWLRQWMNRLIVPVVAFFKNASLSGSLGFFWGFVCVGCSGSAFLFGCGDMWVRCPVGLLGMSVAFVRLSCAHSAFLLVPADNCVRGTVG